MDPGAAFDLPPPALRSFETEAHANQRQGFVHDEFALDQSVPCSEPLVAALARAVVQGIAGVRQHHPASRVDQQRLHRLRFARLP